MKRAMSLCLAVALLTVVGLFNASRLSSVASAQSQGAGQPETIKHRINPHGADNLTVGSAGQQLPAIAYHGGPLIDTPTPYAIWYGNWNQSNARDDSAAQGIIRDLLANLSGTPYFNINTTDYDSNRLFVSGAARFTRATASANGPQEADDSYSRGRRLRDGDILTIVDSAISHGALPSDPTGVYFVLTSSGVTDPDPRSGWADSNGNENGDKCAWTFGTTQQQPPSGAWWNMQIGARYFLIQRNLSATDSKC